MRLNRFTQYLLTYRVRALLLTFFSAFIPIIGLLSILIASLITLIRGPREGAIFTLAATIPFMVGYLYPHAETYPLAFWAAMGVAVLSNLFTWIFAVLLYKKTNWSTIVQIAALIGVLAVSIIHLAYPDIATWWGKQLQFYYEYALTTNNILKTPSIGSSDSQLEMIQLTKQYATGLMTAAILFNALLQLMVARWWQIRTQQGTDYLPNSLDQELHYIHLSQLAGILFIFSLWMSYLRNTVVLDIMPILYLLFTAAGLSLIHYFFSLMKSTSRWFWLGFLYLTLFFTIPMSMMIVSILALFDSWLNIRKRITKI